MSTAPICRSPSQSSRGWPVSGSGAWPSNPLYAAREPTLPEDRLRSGDSGFHALGGSPPRRCPLGSAAARCRRSRGPPRSAHPGPRASRPWPRSSRSRPRARHEHGDQSGHLRPARDGQGPALTEVVLHVDDEQGAPRLTHATTLSGPPAPRTGRRYVARSAARRLQLARAGVLLVTLEGHVERTPRPQRRILDLGRVVGARAGAGRSAARRRGSRVGAASSSRPVRPRRR